MSNSYNDSASRADEGHWVSDPELDALVRDIIGQVADKWTMLILEVLEEHGRVRFTRLGALVGDISQKMLKRFGKCFFMHLSWTCVRTEQFLS